MLSPRTFPPLGCIIGSALYQQGVVAAQSGDNTTAMTRLAAAEAFLRAPGGSRRLGTVLGERGVIQLVTGHLSEAAQTLIEAVALMWTARYDMALTRPLRGIAGIAAVTNQPSPRRACWTSPSTSTPGRPMASSRRHAIGKSSRGAALAWRTPIQRLCRTLGPTPMVSWW